MSVPIALRVENTDAEHNELSSSFDLRRTKPAFKRNYIAESPPSFSSFLAWVHASDPKFWELYIKKHSSSTWNVFSVGRVPDEPQADMTTSPASSGENLGLFMLRKDSERRDTLHRILTEYMSNVVQNIQETLPQVRSHTTVSPDVFDVECCHTTSALS